MSEPHEEIARRLAELGRAQAPSELRREVMAQVAAEPRRRPRRSPRFGALIRPATRIALVASVVLAAGVGIAHLGSGHSASFSASSSAPQDGFLTPTGSRSTVAGEALTRGTSPSNPDVPKKSAIPSRLRPDVIYGQTLSPLTVDRITAQTILGRYLSGSNVQGTVVARVPARELHAYQFRLSAAALPPNALWQTLDPKQFVRILLLAARDRRH